MKHLYSFAILLTMAGALGCGKGDAGAPGTTLQSSHQCSVTTTVSGAQIILYYEVDSFSTGDKFVSCVVSDAGKSLSTSGYLRSADPSYTGAKCAVVGDIDTISFGLWEFTYDGTTASVTYNDATSSANGASHTYAASECKTY